MKVLVHPYSFDKANRRITFTSYPSISLENVLLITNVKTNDIIYNFSSSTLGGSLASYSVLQLDFDTTSMANTDPLQIFYDDGLTAVPVTDNSGSLTVDNNGTFAVQAAQTGIWNSLATILNFPATQSVTQGTSPWVTSGLATVTQSGVVHVDDNSSSLTVDGTVAATQSGAWTNSLTGLVSLASGTEVKSVATILNWPATQAVSGTVTANQGTSPWVTSGTATITPSGVVHVDDNSGSLTVDGTVAATQSGSWSASVNGLISLASGTELRSLATILNFPTTQAVTQSGTWNVGLSSGTNFVGFATVAVSTPTLFAVVNTGTVNLNSGATVNVMNFPATEAVTQSGNWGVYASLASNTIVQVGDNGGSLTVDGTVGLGSGTSFIGFATVAVSTPTLFAVVNTGNVNITSGATVDVMNFPATQAVTQSTSPWVVSGTATVTQSGVVHVDDNSGSITVDGTVGLGSGTNFVGFATVAVSTPTLYAVVNTSAQGVLSSLATVLNFPAVQTIAGTATVTQSGIVHVDDNSSSLTVDNAGTFAVQAAQSGLWGVYASLASNTIVQVGDNGGSLTVDGTVAATQSGGWNVGLSSGTNFVGFATVAVSTPTLFAVVNTGSVTLNSGATVNVMNFPATEAVTQSGTWNVGLTGLVSLASGTEFRSLATILNWPATEAVTQSGTWNVGLNAGTNFIGFATVAVSTPTLFAVVNTSAAGVTNSLATILNFPATQAVTQSTSPWVTAGLATVTQSGVVHVDDNSSSLTVDNAGTFAVQAAQSGSWGVYASLASGTIVQVGDNGGTVSVDDGAGSLTVDNNGTFAVQSTQSGLWGVYASLASGTIVQVGDNGGTLTVDNGGTFAVQAAQSGAWGVYASLASGTFITTDLTSVGGTAVARGAGAVSNGTQRVTLPNDTGRTLLATGGAVSAAGDNGLVAYGTAKTKVYAFSLSTSSTSAITARFLSGGGGAELWRAIFQAPTSITTGANLAVTPPAYLFASASGATITLNLSSAATINWSLSYFDEA